MKKNYILFVILLVGNLILAQAPDIEWQTALGGTGNDYAESIKQTLDGGYIVVGRSDSNNGDIDNSQGGFDAWVVKLDATGSIDWQKSFGGSNIDEAYDVVILADGSFVVVGATSSSDGDLSGFPPITQGSMLWIFKIDSDGSIIDQATYGGNFSETGRSISHTSDGGFIISGNSGDDSGDVTENFGGLDFWIVKVDSNLDLEWQKSLGGNSLDAANSAIQTIDGGFIIVGEVSSTSFNGVTSNGDYDIGAVKLDSNGNVVWQKLFGGSNPDYGYSVIQNPDSTYMIAGSTRSSNGDVTVHNGFADFWIIKLSTDGNIIWEKTYGAGSFETAWDIKATADNSYVIVGEYNTGADKSFRVLKINAIGDILWTKDMGGSGFEDSGRSIQVTSDNGFIITGITQSNDGDVTGYQGAIDFWVVKLEPDVLSVSEFEGSSIKIYPNPTTTLLNIDTEHSIDAIQITNMLGQTVLTQNKVLNKTLDVSSLQKGMYFLNITSNNQQQVIRFVKN